MSYAILKETNRQTHANDYITFVEGGDKYETLILSFKRLHRDILKMNAVSGRFQSLVQGSSVDRKWPCLWKLISLVLPAGTRLLARVVEKVSIFICLKLFLGIS